MNGEHPRVGNRPRRFLATAIDALLLPVTALLIMLVSGLMETAEAYVWPQPVVRILALVVFSYLLLNGWGLLTKGQTLGKRWLGLRICALDGEPLAVWRHAIRILAVTLTALAAASLLGVWGLLLVFVVDALFILGAAERCLHDVLSGSRVERMA